MRIVALERERRTTILPKMISEIEIAGVQGALCLV